MEFIHDLVFTSQHPYCDRLNSNCERYQDTRSVTIQCSPLMYFFCDVVTASPCGNHGHRGVNPPTILSRPLHPDPPTDILSSVPTCNISACSARVNDAGAAASCSMLGAASQNVGCRRRAWEPLVNSWRRLLPLSGFVAGSCVGHPYHIAAFCAANEKPSLACVAESAMTTEHTPCILLRSKFVKQCIARSDRSLQTATCPLTCVT